MTIRRYVLLKEAFQMDTHTLSGKLVLFYLLVGLGIISGDPLLALANESSSLLSQYQSFDPFHEYLQDYMPVQECAQRKNECSWKIKLEDNPQKFDRLLEQTEQQHDVNDKQFIASPLGRRYRSLKNFMDIQENFAACQGSAKTLTGDHLRENLQRVLTNTSTVQLEDLCASPKADSVLSHQQVDFAEDFIELQLEHELLLDSLERSLEARILFDKKFNKKDIRLPSFQKQLLTTLCPQEGGEHSCNEEEKNDLNTLIKKQTQKVLRDRTPSPGSSTNVANNLNSHITQINEILQEYNQKKKELEEQFRENNSEEEKRRVVSNKRAVRQKRKRELSQRRHDFQEELMHLKKEVFDEYQSAYSTHEDREIAALLQTQTIKDSTQIAQLEQTKAKWLGFGGFQHAVLKNENDFPLLSTIDAETARKAMDESLDRTKAQIQELLRRRQKGQNDHGSGSRKERRKNLVYLFTVSPTSTGHVLINNPEYSSTFCKIAQDMARDKRNRNILVKGGFVTLAIAGAGATFITAGTASPAVVALAGAAGGAVYTVSETLYLKNKVKKNHRLQADMLNAYLAGLGDKQSPEDIRKNWQDILESDYHISMAPWFLLADATGAVPIATKGVALFKINRTIKAFSQGSKRHTRLLSNILKNNDSSRAVYKLINRRSETTTREFLNFMSRLSKEKQNVLLKTFSNSRSLTAFVNSPQTKMTLSQNQFSSLKKIASRRPKKQINTSLLLKKTNHVDTPLREIIFSKGFEREKARVFYKALVGKSGAKALHITPEIKDLISRIPKNRLSQSPHSAKVLGLVLRSFNNLGSITPKDARKVLRFIKTWDDQSLAGLGRIYTDTTKIMAQNQSLQRNSALLLSMKKNGIKPRVIRGMNKCMLF